MDVKHAGVEIKPFDAPACELGVQRTDTTDALREHDVRIGRGEPIAVEVVDVVVGDDPINRLWIVIQLSNEAGERRPVRDRCRVVTLVGDGCRYRTECRRHLRGGGEQRNDRHRDPHSGPSG